MRPGTFTITAIDRGHSHESITTAKPEDVTSFGPKRCLAALYVLHDCDFGEVCNLAACMAHASESE